MKSQKQNTGTKTAGTKKKLPATTGRKIASKDMRTTTNTTNTTNTTTTTTTNTNTNTTITTTTTTATSMIIILTASLL